ncbi:MFS general substrate transporter [Testicularia cyperi]|uniref:MFS general substrate transporter n=1 Tax=Testicularia cyperi TaxID=1882483 RepID=A0A317XRB6_9BASI|nr:MFS general substrate transporter [Testicularia cyperi]
MASIIEAPKRVLSRTLTNIARSPTIQQQQHGFDRSIPAPLQPLTDDEIEAIKLVGDEDSRGWTNNKKWLTTIIISLMGFISPLGSSILVPGGAFVDHDFDLDSRTLAVLPVSLFVLGLGIGPFILAPWSETVGRHPVYVVTSFIFILFNLGTALSPDYATLNVLRFFAGAAGSTGPSLGAGSIGDMFAPSERGRAQSLYGLGPLMGPVLGSVVGGFVAQSQHDWHWLLWTSTILSGITFVAIVLFLKETYAPVLLREKRQRAIKERLDLIRERDPETATLVTPDPSLSQRLQKLASKATPSRETLSRMRLAQSRPFRLLFTNPICAIFSFYLGFCYGIIYLFLTQHPLLFQERNDEPDAPPPDVLPTYNWTLGIASLSYLGLGLGFLVAAFTNVLLQDSIYARLVITDGKLGWFLFSDRHVIEQVMEERKYSAPDAVGEGKEPDVSAVEKGAAEGASASLSSKPTVAAPVKKGRPEYRLPLCLVGMFILPCGLILFGWSAENQTHWIVPLIGSFIVGYATILCFQTILVYLVDAFVPYSASATACAVLVRSILAAGFPLCAEYMFEDLGYGWSCTLLALVAVCGIPVPLILYRYGEHLRLKYKFKG